MQRPASDTVDCGVTGSVATRTIAVILNPFRRAIAPRWNAVTSVLGGRKSGTCHRHATYLILPSVVTAWLRTTWPASSAYGNLELEDRRQAADSGIPDAVPESGGAAQSLAWI